MSTEATEKLGAAIVKALSIPQKLSFGRARTRKYWRWMTHAVIALIPVETDLILTLGVSERMVMLYNPECVRQYSIDELAGALLHEVSHILRAHHKRWRMLGVDPDIGNIAGDLTINNDLRKAGIPTRPEWYFPEKLGFPPDLTTEEYIKLLQKMAKEQGKDSIREQAGSGAGSDSTGGGDGGIGQGTCGSCAGKAVPGEPKGAHTPAGVPKEDNNPATNGRSDAQIERIKKITAHEIQKSLNNAKEAGSIPGEWKVWAGDLLKPPKVNWRQRLPRYVRNAIAFRRGSVDFTRSRIARRQAGIGIGPGKPLLPAMHEPRPLASIWFDTSGSMGRDELVTGASECSGILQAVGCRVKFFAFDAKIQSAVEVESIHELVKHLVGGGGTSFIPVIDAMQRLYPKPDVAVIVTDGCGPAPATPPKNIKVIWLLVGKNTRVPATWGDVVVVDD